MLVLLARAGAAAHTDVLERSAKARLLMSLEVRKAYEHIRVHNRSADFRVLDVLASDNGNLDIVGAFKSVADDDRAPDGERREAVCPCALHVLDGVFAASGVERVAVGQKRDTARLLDQIHDRPCIVRAQEAEVAKLTEVHFDGDELFLHVDFVHAGGLDKLLELFYIAHTELGAKITEINL